MKSKAVFSRLLLFLLCSPCFVQAQSTVKLYQGLEETTLDALPYVRPPYANLYQFLQALGGTPVQVGGQIEVEINRRKLVMDPVGGTVRFNRKLHAFPIRRKDGLYYVRVDVLSSVFTELFGRRMIYEPTSRSLHVPLARDLMVTVRTRQVGETFRIILIYSDPVSRPTLKVDGRNLVLKIKEKNIQFDRSGFVANEAVPDMQIFQDLPDGSTEILFTISKDTEKWEREPFQPENPRTVIKLTGDYADPLDGVMTRVGNEKNGIRRVVIDPGHGGIDKGAEGPTGLAEKDVALDLALALQENLGEDYEILLTRKDDTFLSLKTRTAIANNFSADLFLSIHVNAISLPGATGSETYYLSLDAKVPDHYNEDEDGDEGAILAPPEDDLSLILWDMAQTKFAEDSFRMARYVQESLNVLSGIRNRGVKQASLKVLKGAGMPAVLVEVAFISNRVEESKLKTTAFRKKIVNAISKAIRLFDEDVRSRSKNASKSVNEGL